MLKKILVVTLALVAAFLPAVAMAQVTPVYPQVNVGRVGVASPTLVTGTAAAGQISSTLSGGCGSTASYSGLVNTDFAGRFTASGAGQSATTCTQTLGGSYTGTNVTNSLYCTVSDITTLAANPTRATVNVVSGVATVTYTFSAAPTANDIIQYMCVNAGGQ
jgi:hypothetical protein